MFHDVGMEIFWTRTLNTDQVAGKAVAKLATGREAEDLGAKLVKYSRCFDKKFIISLGISGYTALVRQQPWQAN
jgi:hypothetical protein